MGVKIEQFDNPVCNSFKARVLNDQLCYEVDLEKFKNPGKLHLQLKLGLVFFMDYNEDKQLVFENSVTVYNRQSRWRTNLQGTPL